MGDRKLTPPVRWAAKIARDICGRSGGDHWYEGANSDTREEILDAWTDIIAAAVLEARLHEITWVTEALKSGRTPLAVMCELDRKVKELERKPLPKATGDE